MREIRGRVQFAETGVPIAHATVIIQELRSSEMPGGLPPITEVVRAATSESGAFSLQIPENKHLMIRVLGEQCRWNGHTVRLDKVVDLDAPLEISVTAWECNGNK